MSVRMTTHGVTLAEAVILPKPARALATPRDIPMSWKAALRLVQRIYPGAQLAGGALRDRDAGVKVKDLDFFATQHDGSFDEAQETVRWFASQGIVASLSEATLPYTAGLLTSKIAHVVDFKIEGCPPCQLIIGDFDMTELLKEFDFGVCQIAFDGKVITKTGNYERDFRRRKFRMVTECSDRQFIRRLERWHRLSKKDPPAGLSTWAFEPKTRCNCPITAFKHAMASDMILPFLGRKV